MAEGLNKKLHVRNGHRSHVLDLFAEFSGTNEEDLLNLKKLEKSLEEKVKILKNLDDEKREVIPDDEADTLTYQINISYQFSDKSNSILVKIEIIFSKSKLEFFSPYEEYNKFFCIVQPK